MVILGFSVLCAAARGVMQIHQVLRKEGVITDDLITSRMLGFEEFNEFMGLSRWIAVEKKFWKS